MSFPLCCSISCPVFCLSCSFSLELSLFICTVLSTLGLQSWAVRNGGLGRGRERECSGGLPHRPTGPMPRGPGQFGAPGKIPTATALGLEELSLQGHSGDTEPFWTRGRSGQGGKEQAGCGPREKRWSGGGMGAGSWLEQGQAHKGRGGMGWGQVGPWGEWWNGGWALGLALWPRPIALLQSRPWVRAQPQLGLCSEPLLSMVPKELSCRSKSRSSPCSSQLPLLIVTAPSLPAPAAVTQGDTM